MDTDSFQLNISGVQNLVESGDNKTRINGQDGEGVVGQYTDILNLPMSDEKLLKLKVEWENKSDGYLPKVKARQDLNKTYLLGRQKQATSGNSTKTVSSNLLFEATSTYVPQALAKNPEPVVFSDNTEEGKQASGDLKTMLQYHADVLCLRKKLGVMVWHWSIYFLGVIKHGWDSKSEDIKTEIRKPQNFILDPDGYVDEYGSFVGSFLGERMDMTAEKLAEMFPSKKAEITIKVDGKMGTQVVATEWWTDDYCFTTFQDLVLDKHKNQYFNYEEGNVEETQSATPKLNHFASPKMPYTFLSVFSMQEHPHDFTNLIEQNIANQDRINDRDDQISKNLRFGNNSIAVSGLSFTVETASQAARALEDGDPVLVPDGRVDEAIKRIPANNIPDSVFKAQDNDKLTLRSIYGTQGLTAEPQSEDTTARGMILNQSHDSTRIGGGMGDALEQVADNIFNWWTQLYAVFYDTEHYGAVMGNGRAVEYVAMLNTMFSRKFVVSVSPNSMQPKDEISQQNMAVERWNNKAIDPISFMKEINDPDPLQSAKKLVLWTTNPQQYAMTYFPEDQVQQPPQQGTNLPNQQGTPPPTIAAPPASPALSQVPISTNALPK